ERQGARLQRVRAERDNGAVQKALRELADYARSSENLMPPIIAAVKTYATLGEITDVFREVFGVYHEPVFF
ncbi:MAG: methylmalonyl-CoA mutase family protein, partial [Caldilineales bacterium]|nr:methylmalonyl-CoA mutase family protein [Caldilineales bacterium]